METIPVWVLLVCLGALGALCVILIGIVKDHIKGDTSVHERVAVHEEQIKKLDTEIYRPDGIMDRLHDHGGKLHTLQANDDRRTFEERKK